jgi:hypothetical protein
MHQELCVLYPNRCTVYSKFIELGCLYMLQASTAHLQEVMCMYLAIGTSEMTVSKPRLADSYLRSTICHMNTPYLSMMGH